MASPVEPNQPRGRDATVIKRDQKEMPERPADPAVALPPARGRDDAKRRAEQRPFLLDPPNEIDVFHDWQIGETPDGLESFPSHEQRLVAVREPEERDAQPHAELDQAGERGRRVQRETVTSRDARSAAMSVFNCVAPAAGQPAVRVKKQKPVAARRGRAGIHLTRTSSRRLEPDDVRPREAEPRQRRILWSRHDDDFSTRRVGDAKRSRERFRIVVNRNDDADREHSGKIPEGRKAGRP